MPQGSCTCVYVADAEADSILDCSFHLTSLQTSHQIFNCNCLLEKQVRVPRSNMQAGLLLMKMKGKGIPQPSMYLHAGLKHLTGCTALIWQAGSFSRMLTSINAAKHNQDSMLGIMQSCNCSQPPG